MMPDDAYEADVTGVYDTHTGGNVKAEIDTKKAPPTYKYAQKEAMKRGDAGTYFMRKSSNKKSRKGGSK